MAIVEYRGGRITYKYLMNKLKGDLAFMVLDDLDRITELEQELECERQQLNECVRLNDKLREAVSLLNSMVLSGEQHSPQSEAMVQQALGKE